MPDINFDLDHNLVNQVLEYLNSGGTRRAVIAAVHQQKPRLPIQYLAQEQDVTGDGVPDLLIMNPFPYDGMFLDAYVCTGGQYKAVGIPVDVYHFFDAAIVGVKDMNLDGVPEIVTIGGDDSVRVVDVFEWDGTEFGLLNPDTTQYSYLKTTCSAIYGPSWVDITDTDSNGTQELVFKQAIPIANPYQDGLPWRKATWFCIWSGQIFVVTHIEFEPPQYRFQAVQDGDRAALAGDYTQALDLYQQVIFSDKLDWWSQNRFFYELHSQWITDCVCTPTPELVPTPDPAEIPMLAAYARFRILLLYTVQGHLSDAQVVYDTLQSRFPPGQVGHVYAQMATAFWTGYQNTQDLNQSCAQAIAFAIDHEADVLGYLGNGSFAKAQFGAQSLVYQPNDLCPYE